MAGCQLRLVENVKENIGCPAKFRVPDETERYSVHSVSYSRLSQLSLLSIPQQNADRLIFFRIEGKSDQCKIYNHYPLTETSEITNIFRKIH